MSRGFLEFIIGGSKLGKGVILCMSKQCPQCARLYEDDDIVCSKDGSLLIAATFPHDAYVDTLKSSSQSGAETLKLPAVDAGAQTIGPIIIGFNLSGTPKEISVTAVGAFVLPSAVADKHIREIIDRRENPPPGGLSVIQQLLEQSRFQGNLFGPRPYAERPTQELKDILPKLKEIYREDDLYEFYEVHSTKVGLAIENQGESYIEDASIIIEIPVTEGLHVATRIHLQPYQSKGLFDLVPPSRSVTEMVNRQNYPTVEKHNAYIEIQQSIGALRHALTTVVFREPLRIVFGNELIGKKIEFRCRLYGKQLRTPLMETLTINVVAPAA